MSNTGRAAQGKVYTARGSLVPPSFQDIGTNSGLTDNGVLIASGNNPFTVTAAGVTGQVLMGNTGADPSFQNGGTVVGQTITGDDSVILSPTAGNWNILGQDAGSVSVMDTNGSVSTLRIEDRTWTTEFVVDPSSTVGLRGTYTTIQSAVTAASAGDTVFVRSGTYTEDIALKTGVNITGLPTDGIRGGFVQSEFTPTVKIIGKLTYSSAGSICLSNLFLQTNSDFILQITGTEISNIALENCYLNCTNNIGISSTTTSGNINLLNCNGDLGTTGISYFALSGGGNLAIIGGRWANTGNSVTACTWTAGILTIRNCEFNSFLTSSTASSLGANIIYVWFNSGALNTTTLTHGNTTASSITVNNCNIDSGSASSISVGAGASMNVIETTFKSSNTNVITGSGSISYSGLSYYGTSSNINTTTQVLMNEGPSRTIGSANTGAGNTLTVTNSSNTASSTANIVSTVGGTSAADATYQAAVAGTTTWTWGVDNSDSDAYVLAQGTALGTNNVIRASVAGEINYPLQPAFLAYLPSVDADQTGDGTSFTLGSVTALTEVFDQNADFATATFTAPITGRYYLGTNYMLQEMAAGTNTTNNAIVTSNNTYTLLNNANCFSGNNSYGLGQFVDMDAADTATILIAISGGTKIINVFGDSGRRTNFYGWLVA